MGLDQLARPLAYPLSATSDRGLYFDFADPAAFGSGWTVVAGAAPTVSGGVATPANGSEHVIIRPNESIGDVEFVWRVNANATSGGSWSTLAKYIDNNNYLMFRWTPNVGSFDVFYKDGGSFTQVIGTGTLTATSGTPYWVRASIIGNTLRIELWTTDPAAGGSPNQAATYVLAGAQATKFGAGVRGKVGLRHNSPATHTLGGLIIRPLGRPPRQRDVQVFTSSGTWTKPAGAAADPNATTRVVLIGGGGGGGSGARNAPGVAISGGGGGGGAGLIDTEYPTSSCKATSTVTVGAGGAGGAAVTTDTTNGAVGSDGTDTTVDLINGYGFSLRAARGAGGSAGSTGASSGGAPAAGSTRMGGMFTGGSGAGTSAGGVGGSAISQTLWAPAGGGGGGGINASNVDQAGGQSGVVPAHSGGGGNGGGTAGGGAGAGGNINSGVPIISNDYRIGCGGSGGGGNASGAGGNGGSPSTVGYLHGGGGGGGGASRNGANSGAGGTGGHGLAIIITEWGG